MDIKSEVATKEHRIEKENREFKEDINVPKI
jgi:hypothetical protein